MVHQASVERHGAASENGKRQSAAASMRDGIGEVLHDIVSLGELQTKLLAVDARESMQKAQVPFVLLLMGAVLALCATPVLLLAVAEALHELAGWDRWLAYVTSGGVAAALGGILLWLACRQAGAVLAVFARSQAELAENIRWIKYALTQGRRPPR